MNTNELELQRQRLLLRSAELRVELSDQVQVLKQPLAVVDHARAGLQWLYGHPEWTLGAAVILIIFRPRRSILLAGRLWWTWRTFQRIKNWMAAPPLQRLRP